MTQKLFWQDPYQTKLETVVQSQSGDTVTLQATLFYAQSGGQESDSGIIGGFPVISAEKQGDEIIYSLPPEHTLKVGDPVVVKIDWPRRYRLMRLHFAAEILLELVYQRFPGIEKVGAHIAEEKARIDFLIDESLTPHVSDLTQVVNDIIEQDHPIISAFSDEKTGRRYWQIDGFSKVPCGGTHVKSTGEVGKVRIKRKNPGKGKERLEVTLCQSYRDVNGPLS